MRTTMTRTRALTGAILLGLAGLTTSTHGAPEPAEDVRSVVMMMIDDAVEANEEDPNDVFFIVCLPDDEDEASEVFGTWKPAGEELDDDVRVFYVRGVDRDEVMEKCAITEAPAFIAFRGGYPVHARTGCAESINLESFVSIALDPTAPPTYSADQSRVLYEDMVAELASGEFRSGAEHACLLMLNLHALVEGPYNTSFGRCEIAQMDLMYNQSVMRVAQAAGQDPAAEAIVARTSRTAKRTWDKGAFGHLGIALWMDLAPSAGYEDEVVAWANGYERSGRVAQALERYGARIRPMLIDHGSWGALARTVKDVSELEDELADAERFARSIVDDGIADDSFLEMHTSEMARTMALTHAALLQSGRERDAWKLGSVLGAYAGEERASAAMCEAAMELGVLTARHESMADGLDSERFAALKSAMNEAFATVPATDE
jgi:hypothetical protein